MSIKSKIERLKNLALAERENSAEEARKIGLDLKEAQEREKSARLEVERVETKYRAQMALHDKHNSEIALLDGLLGEL